MVFLWTILPQDKFCFFYMHCDFKRMLAQDSWLHSIAFQTLNNQDWVTWVWFSARIQTFQSLLLLETCTLLASKHCWSHQIKFPFRHVNQLSLLSYWFCWYFFWYAPSRVTKVQALTWCSGCTFFKGEHSFQLWSLTSSFCFCFAYYSQYVWLRLLANLFNFSSYSLQDGKV